MVEVRETEEFSGWLSALRDARAKAKILVRIARLAAGNPGDVQSVGKGVSELRINYGPGYRVYYIQRGMRYILLLAVETRAHRRMTSQRLSGWLHSIRSKENDG